jgi:hypothetical protein
MRRRPAAARILLVTVVAAMAIVVWPAPASAQFGCNSRQAPNPRSPTSGVSGLVAQAPETIPTGEPFDAAGNPTEALWGQYGTAGLWWPVYDPGCNPAAEWGMRMATGFAQWGNEAQNFFLNATAAVRSWAWRSDWLGPIDDAMTTFTGSLQGSYTGPMMGVALVAAGLMIVWRGRRADLSHSATLAGWAVAMMVLGVLALSAPTRAAEFVDYYGAGAAATVESAVSGVDVGVDAEAQAAEESGGGFFDNLRDFLGGDADEAEVPVDDTMDLTPRTTDPFVGLAVSEVAYQNWLVGMFGSSDSTTAREYGPRFYEAMALTWEEAALPDEERQEVIDQKKGVFKSLAEELRDVDNSAFKVLQGKTAFEDRMATGWVSALLIAIVTLFGVVAAICVLMARLVARFGVMAFPVVVPFGMVSDYRQPVMSIWKLVSGGVVTAIMFTLASGLMIRLLSAMLRSTMPLLLVVVIALGLTVVLLMKLRAGQVIRTVAGLRIARNLSRDRIRTEDNSPERAAETPDETVEPSTRRESQPAPPPPPPAPTVQLAPAAGSVPGRLAAGTSHAEAPGPVRPHLERATGRRGPGKVIEARVVEPTGARVESPARGGAGPVTPFGRAGASAGVPSAVDPRPAVWYMGPPRTTTGEPYYLPGLEAQQHQHNVSPRSLYEDHVAERDDEGRPIVDVYEPEPDRARPRPLPPVPMPPAPRREAT